MRLVLQRTGTSSNATVGQLILNGEPFCFTLERPSVQIPPGTYNVEMTFSPHFQRMMPLVDGVPGRTAIRIHPGNVPGDSDGCILVGYKPVGEQIEDSRRASDDLNAKVTATVNAALVTLDIRPLCTDQVV